MEVILSLHKLNFLLCQAMSDLKTHILSKLSSRTVWGTNNQIQYLYPAKTGCDAVCCISDLKVLLYYWEVTSKTFFESEVLMTQLHVFNQTYMVFVFSMEQPQNAVSNDEYDYI